MCGRKMNFSVSRHGQRVELKVKEAGWTFSFASRVVALLQASLFLGATDEGIGLQADMLWVAAAWTASCWLLLSLKASLLVTSAALRGEPTMMPHDTPSCLLDGRAVALVRERGLRGDGTSEVAGVLGDEDEQGRAAVGWVPGPTDAILEANLVKNADVLRHSSSRSAGI